MPVAGWWKCSAGPKAYSTAALTPQQRAQLGSRVVENPALILLAMTTPNTFFDAVGSGALCDGFLNRFIIVSTDIGRQVSRRIVEEPPPIEVIAWAKSRRIPARATLWNSVLTCPTILARPLP